MNTQKNIQYRCPGKQDRNGETEKLARFLKRYCVSLSEGNGFSFRRMGNESLSNARLKEPFCLYCYITDNIKRYFPEAIRNECQRIKESRENWYLISRQYQKIRAAYDYDCNKAILKQKAKMAALAAFKAEVGEIHIPRLSRESGLSRSALYKFFIQKKYGAISLARLRIALNTLRQKEEL